MLSITGIQGIELARATPGLKPGVDYVVDITATIWLIFMGENTHAIDPREPGDESQYLASRVVVHQEEPIHGPPCVLHMAKPHV